MGFLTRAEILEKNDIEIKTLYVEEWGGDLRLRTPKGTEIDRYQQSRMKANGKVDILKSKAQLIAMAAVDERGALMFTPADIEALARKSNKALERVAKEVAEMAGLRPESLEAAGESSGSDQTSDSTSDSPVISAA